MVRKGEIACYDQLLLFLRSFPQLYILSASKRCIVKKRALENIVGKEENTGHQHFLLLPCLRNPSSPKEYSLVKLCKITNIFFFYVNWNHLQATKRYLSKDDGICV